MSTATSFPSDGPGFLLLKSYFRLLGWGAAWLTVSLVVFITALDDLPDPVAIHWNRSGVADGSAPVWMIPVAATLIVLLGLAMTPVFTTSREPSMEAFALVGMGGGLATAVVAVTASVNHGIEDWTDAGEVGMVAIVALFGLPVLGLIGGIVLGRHWYPLKQIPRGSGGEDVIEVEAGERVSWVGRARVKGVALVLFVVAVLLLFLVPGLPLWIFVLIAGVGVVFSQVEAQVTNDGMRVRLGGIPVRKVRLEDMSSARTIEADPSELGGWGWRAAPGRTAVVLRAGEAIAVTFTNGRQFIITVDDAMTGAALLNGLIELSHSGNG